MFVQADRRRATANDRGWVVCGLAAYDRKFDKTDGPVLTIDSREAELEDRERMLAMAPSGRQVDRHRRGDE